MNPRAALLAVLLLTSAPAATAAADAAADAAEFERVERDVASARTRLNLVKDYIERGEISSLERARQRFSEAETQFLLEAYDNCAALLRDVVETGPFVQDPQYPTALYYLGESLYQRQSWLEARRYFREAVQRMSPGRAYQDTIVRLIDLADRTGDAHGIDQYFALAQQSGNVRPEVVYLYAKWTARRRDLPPETRIARADTEFARLESGKPFHPQALYFRGALAVQANRLDDAAELFRRLLVSLPKEKLDAKEQRLRDLGNLALARVLHEQGKFPEAVDRYAEVSRNSPDFNDAMFETAATHVRAGNYEQALKTADILLYIGKDSPVAPEAKILQGNLLLRLQQYEKASATFADVVNAYAPVRDQIRSVLERPDPVGYFDSLLRQGGEDMDIEQLLPKDARPWVSTNREVSDARALAGELQQGRASIAESRELAKKLEDALASAKLSLFPQLQDGNARTIELTNTLATLETALVNLELRLLAEDLPAGLRDRLVIAEEARRDLADKIRQLPTTEEEYQERRARMIARIGELERVNNQTRREVEFMRKILMELSYSLTKARDVLELDPGEEQETLERIRQDTAELERLDQLRAQLDRELESQRASAAAQATGGDLEDQLREAYKQQLLTSQQLVEQGLQAARPETQALVRRIGRARLDIEAMQTQLAGMRDLLRQKAVARLEEYRQKVAKEQALLDNYQREVSAKDGATRQLLGQIANDSFGRVARQFYDLVLKADVGIIDVAWAKKRERTDKITQTAQDKQAALQELEERFREVRSDVD